MGCGQSKKSPEEWTVELWRLIGNVKRLTSWGAASEVRAAIEGGAFIDRANPSSGKYMLECVLEQEKRERGAGKSQQANQCKEVADLLIARAAILTMEACRNGDLPGVQLLGTKLGGDLHQSGMGPLGLMAVALKSPNVSLGLIQFLVGARVENRQAIKVAATTGSPPVALHRDPALKADIQQYLHAQLTQLLLELPMTVPAGKGNEGADANRLVEHADAMMKQGADPRLTDPNGNNVICQAVLMDHVPLVRRLLGLGVDSTYVNPVTGNSVLQLAESQSQRDPILIALLKSHSFNLLFQTRIKQVGEQKEADYDQTHHDLQELLTTGADIHALNANQDTPLHLLTVALSRLEGQEDEGRFIKAFISDFHADHGRCNQQNMRAVEVAVECDRNSRILGELLESGSALANPKTKESILAFAKRAKESPFKAANVHLIQAFMNNKLWQVASKCNKRGKNHAAINEEIKALLALGAEVNTPTGDDTHEGWTPLCLIAQQGDAYLVRNMVLTHGASPILAATGETSLFNTPLHLAAQAGQLASVQFLRSLAIDINVLNARKESALHLAASQGHVRVVKFLVFWGCNPSTQNVDGQIPLQVAETGAANTPASPTSKRDKDTQHPLVIAFLARCQVAEVCNEKAHIISQVDPNNIDVCPLMRLNEPTAIVPAPASDEDPLGEVSKGTFKGSPNGNLKSAAKDGKLKDAKQAVSEGADVRHKWDGMCAYDLAVKNQESARRDLDRLSSNATYEKRREYRDIISNCGEVADYCKTVATTKLREAVAENNEARVVAYHQVHGDLGGLAGLAAAKSPSAALMHYLVDNSAANRDSLWNSGASSPYSIAKANKFEAVATYISVWLTARNTTAVTANDLGLVTKCISSGGLPDAEGVENVSVAMGHKNLALVQFLLDAGARIPSRYKDVRAIEGDVSVAPDIRSLLRQRFVDRQARVAAAMGAFGPLQFAHALGADMSAQNYAGATCLSLSLQFTHQPAIVHYIVTRGGSMLHKQVGVPSVVPLSRAPGHPPANQLEQFLKVSLNVALHTSIMEGDLVTAAALSALGAELTSLDDAGNTLVHTAVAFQGLDAVKWVIERGAPLNLHNTAGDLAVTMAVMKGDFSSVEFMIHHSAGIKALKNGAGKTALDLAKEYRYNRLVQLMDPGNPDFPVSADDVDGPQEPSQEPEELLRAASYGQLDVIKVFIEEKYSSLQRKTQLCTEMVNLARAKSQAEVLRILEPHLKSLNSEAASDQTADRLVSASAEQRKILAGFLTGLSGLIAGGEVALDPSDPATYQQLFTNMSTKVGNQTDFLSKNANNSGELVKAVSKDSADLSAKMAKLESEMRAMADSKSAMAKRLAANEAQLAACKTAVAKRDCYKEIQETKDQLNTLASSLALFNRAAEAAQKKKKTLEALKSQPALLLAYSTIENRLQGLFIACKSATSGLMSLEMTDQGRKQMRLVNIASELSDLIPIVGGVLGKIIGHGGGKIVSKMDSSRQQAEIANITTLGNIEELEKASSNAAALLTFYYSAQINSIAVDPAVDPKAKDSIPAFAEFLVLFMVKALQKGEVIPGLDLATQLWFVVACQDPLADRSLSDKLFSGPGDITVTMKADKQKVTLRALVGTVGIIDNRGTLFVPQAKVLAGAAKVKPGFVPFYSVSYLSAFTTAQQVQVLLQKRGLAQASEAESKLFLSGGAKLDESSTKMLQGTVSQFMTQEEGADSELSGAVVPVDSSSQASASSPALGGDIVRVSLQVHDQLASKGLVVTRQQVSEMLKEYGATTGVGVEAETDALREDLNSKHQLYQSTIDAATETLSTESEKLRTEHRAVGDDLKKNVAKQLSEQAALFAKQQAQQNRVQEEKLQEVLSKAEAHVKQLQEQSTAMMIKMQGEHAASITKIQTDAQEAMVAQVKAQQDALTQMIGTSETAAKEAAAAKATAEKAAASAAASLAAASAAQEKWVADLAASKAAFDASLAASNEASAKQIADYKAQLAALKEASVTSAAAAKESAAAAHAAEKQAKESAQTQAKDLAINKELQEKAMKAMKEQAASESKALIAQAKDAQNAASRASDEAKSAQKAASKAASEAEDCKKKLASIEAKQK